jgi:chromosome segregation ATPase
MMSHAEEATKAAFEQQVDRCKRLEEGATKRNNEHWEKIRDIETQVVNLRRINDEYKEILADKGKLIETLVAKISELATKIVSLEKVVDNKNSLINEINAHIPG